MKAYSIVRNSAIASILLLNVILLGCRPTRYLDDNQALVKKVTLKGIDKQYQERIYSYVQKGTRPNSAFKLGLYNTFNTKNGKYRTDKIKRIGEAPNLLDSSLVEISRVQIKKYLQTKGFFNAEVKSDVEIKNKKAYITFTAARGPMFTIKNITYVIADTAVKRLYDNHRASFSHLHIGKRYDADSIVYEINNINNLMHQNGYYSFSPQDMHVFADTNLYSSQANIKINIYKQHQVYKIGNICFEIANTGQTAKTNTETVVVDEHTEYHDSTGRFNAKVLNNYISMKTGEVYDAEKERLTTNRLYDLNVFKNLSIRYIKLPDSATLSPEISATPLKRMSNRIDGEYTFNSGRNGFNIGDTYTNRNVFGGAEQLEVKGKYGILFDSGADKKAFSQVFNRDIQLGATLMFPRLVVPFFKKLISVNGLPHTTFSSSIQLFDQVNAFRNRIFINSLTYDWLETKFKAHAFTPINIEYRNGKFNPEFESRIRSNGYELYIQTNNVSYVSLGSQYTYTYNGARLVTNDNFLYLKASVDMAGNLVSLFAKDKIFDLNYLRYGKTELDGRMYRNIGANQQIVLRINPGIIVPYGKFDVLPYEKNFYAGGSSGVRAWQSRTLGPGMYNRASIQDSITRRNLRSLDQLGEIKFEGNLEYRYLLSRNFIGGKLKGAAFADFGNVWRRRDNTYNGTDGKFYVNKFIKQLAVGIGTGLRYDVDYFVVRLDAAVKVRDPQFINPGYNESPWVIKNLFNSRAFKDRYELTNGPDVYRFVQYNFGIGMPF